HFAFTLNKKRGQKARVFELTNLALRLNLTIFAANQASDAEQARSQQQQARRFRCGDDADELLWLTFVGRAVADALLRVWPICLSVRVAVGSRMRRCVENDVR